MIGDLLEYPFNPAVWGTAAAWVGAIGTSSAFLLAAQVYRRDAKIRQLEQARKVRVTESSPSYIANYWPPDEADPDAPNLVVRVENLSDENIYGVHAGMRRTSLYRYALSRFLGGDFDVSQGNLDAVADSFARIRYGGVELSDSDRLLPSESADLVFDVPFMPFAMCDVNFTDAHNHDWTLRLKHDNWFEPVQLISRTKRQRLARSGGFFESVMAFALYPLLALRAQLRLITWATRNERRLSK